jgi:hypothetical protein
VIACAEPLGFCILLTFSSRALVFFRRVDLVWDLGFVLVLGSDIQFGMVRITEDLLRKRSEHNQGQLATLEEISLHQFEIEKIDVVGDLCKKLKILFLQNNIIDRIGTVWLFSIIRFDSETSN